LVCNGGYSYYVLNLVINGIPSIQGLPELYKWFLEGFKPYYKWNTFNTKNKKIGKDYNLEL